MVWPAQGTRTSDNVLGLGSRGSEDEGLHLGLTEQN